MLGIGEKIPEFDRPAAFPKKTGKIMSEDLKGVWTILFFYPEDFSFICPTEVTGYNSHIKEVEELGGRIIGVSTDSVDTHSAWINELDISYPLISDEDKSLSRAFGVLDESDGRANRATFIIGPDLKIHFVMVTSRNIGRSVTETMRILMAIKTGDSCPADWNPLEEK